MHKITKLLLTISILLLCFTFFGCGERDFRDREEVQNDIESLVPNARLDAIEQESDRCITYVFNNGDFYFDYTESLSDSSMGILLYTNDDYLSRLVEYKELDIEDIVREYGFTGILNKYEGELNLDAPAVRYSGLHVDILVDEYEQIEHAFDFLHDYLVELEDYCLKDKNKYIRTEIRITFIHKALDRSLYYFNYDLIDQKIDLKEHETWAAYLYKEHVYSGDIFDNSVSLDDFYPSKIQNIEINGKRFDNFDEEIIILYEPNREQYYIKVKYGNVVGDVLCDSIQQDIIEEYYPNANYRYEKGKIIYKINGAKYVINMAKNIPYVKRNYKNITIDYITQYRTTNASYGETYMSIEDFAKLVHMTIDEIDYENSSIKLKTMQ